MTNVTAVPVTARAQVRLVIAAVLVALLLVVLATQTTAGAIEDDEPSNVIGGEPSEAGEFPFLASLGTNGRSFCSGSVVDDRWILTAAHCVADDDGSVIVPLDAFYVNVNTLDAELDENRRTVTHILVHPEYDGRPATPQSVPAGTAFPAPVDYYAENDIALLRLSSSAGVEPVELLGNDPDATRSGRSATIVGYGLKCPHSEDCEDNDVLYDGMTAIAEDDWAFDVWATPDCDDGSCTRKTMFSPEHHIATLSGANTCNGDSGGPLLVAGSDGVLRQAGVTSFGYLGCPFNAPAAYSQVTGNAIADWIDGVINPTEVAVEFVRGRISLTYPVANSGIEPELRYLASRSGPFAGPPSWTDIDLPTNWGSGNWFDLGVTYEVEMMPSHWLRIYGFSTVPGPVIEIDPEIDWTDPEFDKDVITSLLDVDGFVSGTVLHPESAWRTSGTHTMVQSTEHGTIEFEYRIRVGRCVTCIEVDPATIPEIGASEAGGSDITGSQSSGGSTGTLGPPTEPVRDRVTAPQPPPTRKG